MQGNKRKQRMSTISKDDKVKKKRKEKKMNDDIPKENNKKKIGIAISGVKDMKQK